eukprot:SM000124S25927  [mRNA]  locus=s124:164688:166376:- [translate_table: standard]
MPKLELQGLPQLSPPPPSPQQQQLPLHPAALMRAPSPLTLAMPPGGAVLAGSGAGAVGSYELPRLLAPPPPPPHATPPNTYLSASAAQMPSLGLPPQPLPPPPLLLQQTPAAILQELEVALSKLNKGTRLCIRDAMYRMACSAAQRQAAAAAPADSCGSLEGGDSGGGRRDGGLKVLASASGQPPRAMLDTLETSTNSLDRSIANLLFHRRNPASPPAAAPAAAAAPAFPADAAMPAAGAAVCSRPAPVMLVGGSQLVQSPGRLGGPLLHPHPPWVWQCPARPLQHGCGAANDGSGWGMPPCGSSGGGLLPGTPRQMPMVPVMGLVGPAGGSGINGGASMTMIGDHRLGAAASPRLSGSGKRSGGVNGSGGGHSKGAWGGGDAGSRLADSRQHGGGSASSLSKAGSCSASSNGDRGCLPGAAAAMPLEAAEARSATPPVGR